MSGKFSSVAGSSSQWSAALRLMDRTNRLTRRQANLLLDQLVIQLDLEREIAAHALRQRLAENKVRR
jgi:site-specific recombinase XerD